MKKRKLLLGAFAVSLALASCGGNDTKDTVKPEFAGVTDKVGTVNQEIDLLENVSAVDDVDGDISSKIEITLMPELTVTNGKVTPGYTGDYEVKYSVSDEAGNVQDTFCTLTVNPALAEKKLYKEFNFGLGDDNPFSVWSFDGLNVETSAYKGNMRIAAPNTDGEIWHIKYGSTVKTKALADYEITYKFTSSVSGKVKFEANDVYTSDEADVVVGKNELTFKFTAQDAKDEQGYCLQLGNLDAFTIDVSEVVVKEIIGEDVWVKENQDFKFDTEGTCTTVFENESEGSLETSSDQATLNITKGSVENGVWQTKLFVKAGADLAKNTKYRISVDILAEKNIDTFEICYNNGDNEKGVTALYGQSVQANVKKTITTIVTPDEAKDNLTLQFQLGQQNTQGDSNVITISNLVVEKIADEDEAIVSSYQFTDDNLYGHFWSESEGTYKVVDNKAILDVTKGTTSGNMWEIWAGVKLGTKLDANRTYVITLDVKSTIDLNGVEALLRPEGTEDNKGGAYSIELKANELKTITIETHLDSDIDVPGITFQLGQIQTAAQVEISNVNVVAKGGSKTESVENYTFGPTDFGAYNDSSSAEGYLYTENNKLVYEMTKIGLVDWHNKLYVNSLVLEADKIYTIEIVGKADKDISCAFFLNPVGKWEPRVSEELKFTTTETTVEFTTPKFAADINFELLWQFGSDVNAALGSAKIEISSIRIYSQDVE